MYIYIYSDWLLGTFFDYRKFCSTVLYWYCLAWFMKPWGWQCNCRQPFFSAACKFWELGISFAHFCGMSTRWERRSQRWQARLGALNPNNFVQSLVSVGALIDHNRRYVWWRVLSWDGSMVEMPSLWDACPAAICRRGAIGEVRGRMRRMMRRRKHLGRVSWSVGWACFTMWSLTSFRKSPISGLSHLEIWYLDTEWWDAMGACKKSHE